MSADQQPPDCPGCGHPRGGYPGDDCPRCEGLPASALTVEQWSGTAWEKVSYPDATLTRVLHDLHHFLDAMRRLAGDVQKLSAYRVTQWQLWGWCERLGLPMPGEKRPDSARATVLANELAAAIVRVNGSTPLSARYGAAYAALAHLHAAGELHTDGLPGQERP